MTSAESDYFLEFHSKLCRLVSRVLTLKDKTSVASKLHELYEGNTFIKPAAWAGLECGLPTDEAIAFMVAIHATSFEENIVFDDYARSSSLRKLHSSHLKMYAAVCDGLSDHHLSKAAALFLDSYVLKIP